MMELCNLFSFRLFTILADLNSRRTLARLSASVRVIQHTLDILDSRHHMPPMSDSKLIIRFGRLILSYLILTGCKNEPNN